MEILQNTAIFFEKKPVNQGCVYAHVLQFLKFVFLLLTISVW